VTRVVERDLTVPPDDWRDQPMPGANTALALTRLDSRAGTFVLHGRFPPGFTRSVAGGYPVAEEFLVLDGVLEIGDAAYRRGDLTYVPAGYVRGGMRTAGGCTVLAWFGGPAIFHPADALPGAVTSGLRSVPVGTPLDLPAASWVRGGAVPAGATGDVIAADLSWWRRLAAVAPPPDAHVRLEKP
jgi:hypothetical protein